MEKKKKKTYSDLIEKIVYDHITITDNIDKHGEVFDSLSTPHEFDSISHENLAYSEIESKLELPQDPIQEAEQPQSQSQPQPDRLLPSFLVPKLDEYFFFFFFFSYHFSFLS